MKRIVATSLALSLLGGGLATARGQAGDPLVDGAVARTEPDAGAPRDTTPAPASVEDGEASAPAPARGNPLWTIPLDSLRATRERPLFSESRRPPAVAVVERPRAVAPPPPPEPVDPEPPALTLVGTIVGSDDTIAVFLDSTAGEVLRLRIGEEGSGWTLSSIDSRTTVFKNGSHEVTLSLPKPEVDPSADTPNDGGTFVPPPFPPPRVTLPTPRAKPPTPPKGRLPGLGAQRPRNPFDREF